jgi:serine/threonine protein kinase
LRYQRKPEQVKEILIQVVKGVKQLHSLGFAHRDLKPDNIVLSLDPLDVRVIDFETVKLHSSKVGSNLNGTPGYYPNKPKWNEGSTLFDIWALGAIILESDLKKDAYFNCGGEEEAKKIARIRTKDQKTCKYLKEILNGTILAEDDDCVISIDEVVQILEKTTFRT